MSPRTQVHTQTEITRLIRAVQKAGLTIQRLESKADGVVLHFDEAAIEPEPADTDVNEWDKVE